MYCPVMREGAGLGDSFRIREVLDSDAHYALQAAERGDFAALRYLDNFGYRLAGAEQRSRAERILKGPGLHLAVDSRGGWGGQLSAWPVDDLTSHFGVMFHEIGPILSVPDRRLDAARHLLSAMVDRIVESSGGVMMLRVEADDHEALLAAQEAGFRLMETTLTFVNDLERSGRNPPGGRTASVRLHQFETDGPLDAQLFEPAMGGAAQVTQDHYHADPRLPDEACDSLYERLLERGLRGVGADCVVMRVGDDGRLQGFGTWRHWSELEPFGVSMAGNSFGFRVPGAPAGFLHEVAAFVCNNSITGNRLLEWSTQASNHPMVNMMCRQPSIRLCRTSHVLHRWTDDS